VIKNSRRPICGALPSPLLPPPPFFFPLRRSLRSISKPPDPGRISRIGRLRRIPPFFFTPPPPSPLPFFPPFGGFSAKGRSSWGDNGLYRLQLSTYLSLSSSSLFFFFSLSFFSFPPFFFFPSPSANANSLAESSRSRGLRTVDTSFRRHEVFFLPSSFPLLPFSPFPSFPRSRIMTSASLGYVEGNLHEWPSPHIVLLSFFSPLPPFFPPLLFNKDEG